MEKGKAKWKKQSKKYADEDSQKFWRLWPKDYHRPYGPGIEPEGLED